MKLVVDSRESGSRWELEIDADRQTVLDLLDSDEWIENVESEFLTEDWNRKGKGFDVYGMDDDEISEIVDQIKSFFEDQGLDVEDVEYVADDNGYIDDTDSDTYVDDEEEEFLDSEKDEELFEDYLAEEEEEEEIEEEEDDEEY